MTALVPPPLAADPAAATIPGLIAAHAATRPTASAILAPERPPLTYARLHRQIGEAHGALAALGIGRADRVVLALPDGPELAVALLAASAAAVAVPLDPESSPAELAHLFGRLRPAAVVAPAGAAGPAGAAADARGLPLLGLTVPPDAPAGVFVLDRGRPPAPPLAPAARPGDDALVLPTSGTTGRPRLVPLTHANLLASALAVRDAQQLTAADRCLYLMRMFHIAFIGNLFAAMAGGAAAVCPPAFAPERFFAWLGAVRPTMFMAPPPVHRTILAHAPAHAAAIAAARPGLRFVRSGGAPLPPDLEAALEAVFGAPVLQGYGMTEAAPSVAAMPLPPRPRKPGAVGVATGPEIAVWGDGGAPLPPGAVGEIVVRGANLARGYLDDPAATAAAFAPGGWFRTGDLGYLDDDGYLFITGRLTDLINRGGQKVAPSEVEAALLRHEAVAEAIVFPVPDPRLGEEVGAAVVARPGRAADEAALRAFVAARLAPYKVPRRVVAVAAIPKGPTGKPLRAGLAERFGLVAATATESAAPSFVPPRTPLEAAIAAVWAEVLGLERVGADDDFLSLGGDSLQATRVVARLRRLLRRDLSPAAFFDAPTVAAMAAVIDDGAPPAR